MPTEKEFDDVASRLCGDFRELLADRDALLMKVCDYAASKAKRKRVPEWSIIGEIFGHGSGVSAAIYELYRRKQ